MGNTQTREVMNGMAVYEHDNGDVYSGEWLDDKQHGLGVYRYKGGDVYSGGFHEHKACGSGVFDFKNGAAYSGEFVDGEANGNGVHDYKSGDIYTGEWKDGERNGQGVYYNRNGNVYSGEWRNHKYNGVGVYDYEDGDVYYGEFRNDKLHGFGVHSSKRAGVFSGEYRDHKANGVGVYDDKVGNVFSGEFRDSKLHGHAIFKAVVGEKTFEVWEYGEQKSSVPFDPNNSTHRDVEQRAQAAKVRIYCSRSSNLTSFRCCESPTPRKGFRLPDGCGTAVPVPANAGEGHRCSCARYQGQDWSTQGEGARACHGSRLGFCPARSYGLPCCRARPSLLKPRRSRSRPPQLHWARPIKARSPSCRSGVRRSRRRRR